MLFHVTKEGPQILLRKPFHGVTEMLFLFITKSLANILQHSHGGTLKALPGKLASVEHVPCNSMEHLSFVPFGVLVSI